MKACRDAGRHSETRAPRELLTIDADFQNAPNLHAPSTAPGMPDLRPELVQMSRDLEAETAAGAGDECASAGERGPGGDA